MGLALAVCAVAQVQASGDMQSQILQDCRPILSALMHGRIACVLYLHEARLVITAVLQADSRAWCRACG